MWGKVLQGGTSRLILMKYLSLAERGLWDGENGGGNLTNVQCKPIQNCHNESPYTTNV
jgi:hypothetical protein